ncbi:MAG: nucleotidyl transferase AbiEii/AbiGii toxin family protein [Spirochaetaceae bacterium]|nr:nucleotidyl transferase AbiEii/AbiGii toxin family protein [Spirochaetaceae bacterium]
MLEPMLDILPKAQRELWPALVEIPDNFVLYGGTALALRLGHRSSVDFDFFSSQRLDTEALYKIPFVADAEVLQREPTALTLSVNPPDPVKVSFFGDIGFGRVSSPDQTADGVLAVASLLDLFGTKLKVLLQRVAARDYLDLAAILRAGIPLQDGLGAAVALYGNSNEFPRPTPSKRLLTTKRTLLDRLMARRAGFFTQQALRWDFTVTQFPETKTSLIGP